MAIHNLAAILQDKGSTSATFATTPGQWSVTGLPSDARTLELQKSDGERDLVVWREPAPGNVQGPDVTVTVGYAASGPVAITEFAPLGSSAPVVTASGSVTTALGSGPLVFRETAAAPTSMGKPSLAAQQGDVRVATGQAISFSLPAHSFTTTDNGTVSLSAKPEDGSAMPSWLSFDPATGTFTGTAPAHSGTERLVVVATTPAGAAAEAFSIITRAVAPTLARQQGDIRVAAGSAWSTSIPADAFVDPSGGTVSYAATRTDGTALPGWARYDSATNTLSGTAPSGGTEQSFMVIATTTGGGVAAEAFHLYASATPPVLRHQAQDQDQRYASGQPFSFSLPAASYADPSGGPVSLAAQLDTLQALPAWLSYDTAAQQFHGSAPGGSGSVGIRIDANTASGGHAAEAFHMYWS